MADPGWTVVFAAAAAGDLALIEDHLAAAYRDFGESPAEARAHATARVEGIVTAAERLAAAPLRGTAHDGWLPGLRHLTIDRAIYWFVPDAAQRRVRVLAIFFGAEDHRRKMLVRLLSAPRG